MRSRRDIKDMFPMNHVSPLFPLSFSSLSSFLVSLTLPQTQTQKKEPRLVIEPGLPHNKEGGYLLSHIALQYHRRKRA